MVSEPRGIRRRTHFELTDSLVARFWSGVDKREENECWPWTKSLRQGYGAIAYDLVGRTRRVLSAHVVSFVIHKGDVPERHIVAHDCDNRVCCNPKHLHAATYRQNALEMFARSEGCRGEKNGNAKLTAADVLRIREEHARTGFKANRLSRLLGLPRHAVEGVIYGQTWKHIQVPIKLVQKELFA